MYWRIGQRVHVEILGGERAAYGQQIVASLGERLAAEFGRGFEAKNLRRMVQFAESFPDFEIAATLSRQLTWSMFVEVIPLKDPTAREFYAACCWRRLSRRMGRNFPGRKNETRRAGASVLRRRHERLGRCEYLDPNGFCPGGAGCAVGWRVIAAFITNVVPTTSNSHVREVP